MKLQHFSVKSLKAYDYLPTLSNYVRIINIGATN